jgi:ER membrane protein complex subunit 3
MAASQFMVAQGQPGQPQDYNKLFKAEKDNLELAQGLYSWNAKDVEIRVLQKWGKLPKGKASVTELGKRR